MGQYICSARKFVHGYELIGTLVILTSLFINPWNYFVNALVLILCAVSLYFYIAIVIADRNWLDIRAVFTAVWLATLGLAALRLLGYQEQWRNMTWCLCAVGYLMFQIGANLGLCVGKKCMPHIKNIKRTWFGTEFQFQPDRLFVICIVTTLIGMACFITNVAIKGFIPCFSNEPSAYVDFYTKFHVFATAATAICGCCYYCIKTQKLSVAKKFILWFCIFYNLILFPTLVVSRGVFVVAAIAFITVVFYLNKRKFWVVFICFAFVGGMYMLMSNLRSLADWQLDVILILIQLLLVKRKSQWLPQQGQRRLLLM